MNKKYCNLMNLTNLVIIVSVLCLLYLVYRYGRSILDNMINLKEGLNEKKPKKGCTKPTEIDGNCLGSDGRGSPIKATDGTYYKNCKYKCTNMCDLETQECINKEWCLNDGDCLETGKVTLIPSRHNNEQKQHPANSDSKISCPKGEFYCEFTRACVGQHMECPIYQETSDKHGCEKNYKFCGNDFFPPCQLKHKPCVNYTSLGDKFNKKNQHDNRNHHHDRKQKHEMAWCATLGEHISSDEECPFNPNILQKKPNQVIDYTDPTGDEHPAAYTTKSSVAKPNNKSVGLSNNMASVHHLAAPQKPAPSKPAPSKPAPSNPAPSNPAPQPSKPCADIIDKVPCRANDNCEFTQTHRGAPWTCKPKPS